MTAVFPQAPLDVEVGLQLAAGTWTDATAYAYQREGTTPPIAITRGKPDETTQISSGSMKFQANNRDGRWTIGNPSGAWYGQLIRNTPVRCSVPASTVYMRLEGDSTSLASCPGVAAGTNLDVRIDVNLSGYPALQVSGYAAAGLFSSWTTTGNHRSWALLVQGDGTLLLQWSTDGTLANVKSAASTVAVPLGRTCLRATLTAATGTVTFFTAPAGDADTGPWTQLGLVVVAGSTTLSSTTSAPLKAGYSGGLNTDNAGITGPTGEIYEAEMRQAVAGTVLAHPVFTSQTAGATSFTDAQANTWTLAGTAELSARSYRFHGEYSSSPKQQDTSGTDLWVPASCGGIMRRLQQANTTAVSPMQQAVLAQAGTFAPVAYWPCEDLQGATVLASALGGPAMTIGTGSGSPQLASDSSFAASNPLPVVNGSTWVGFVPSYTSNGSIIVRFLIDMTTAPANNTRLIRMITTGTCSEVSVYYDSAGSGFLGVAGFNGSGTVFDTGGFLPFLAGHRKTWITVELVPSGSTVLAFINSYYPADGGSGLGPNSYTGTVGNLGRVIVNPNSGVGQVTIGHVSVQSAAPAQSTFQQPLQAWEGELAANRFARLCSENGIAPRVYGFPLTSAAMGVQPVDTLPDLLQQCEDADRGMIFEPRQAYGLGFRPLTSLYNQAPGVVLDWTVLKQLAGDGWQPPDDDDQYTVNDWTLQRDSGGSGTSGASYRGFLNDGSAMSIADPPAGVGDYANSASVNVELDTQLPGITGFMVHVGTVNEPRFPAIPVDLARPEMTPVFYQVQGINLGDRVDMQSPPAGYLTPNLVKQLAFAVTEELGGFFWRLTWTAVPESPWETGIFDDVTYGRADTDGTNLVSSATAAATQLTVQPDVSAYPLWTTAQADFPFDVQASGERITVTDIGGPPNNFLGGDNAAFDASLGNWTNVTNSAVAQSTAQAHSGPGSMRMTSVASGLMTAGSCLAANITSQGMACSPGDQIACSCWFLSASAATPRTVEAGVQFYNSGGSPISTLFGTGTATDGSSGWVKATGLVTAPASSAWCRLVPGVQATGGGGEIHYIDDAYLGDVTSGAAVKQTMVATRSVNGVSKAQAAGTDIRLFTPTIFAIS